MQFKIKQLSQVEDRLPLHHEVFDYLEKFVTENVLVPNKIILNSKWNITVIITFCQEGHLKKVSVFKPNTFNDISLKSYPVLIPFIGKISSSENKYLSALNFIYDGITVFFVKHYKKVTLEYMGKMREKIKFEYLLTLPFPASLQDQRYESDLLMPNGQIKQQMY